MRISTLPLVLLTASSLLAQAPTQTGQAGAPLTIKAQARLVVVDVVVSDHGKPVHDLKQSDFAIREMGQRQQIVSFEEHKALTAGEAAKFAPNPRCRRERSPTLSPPRLIPPSISCCSTA